MTPEHITESATDRCGHCGFPLKRVAGLLVHTDRKAFDGPRHIAELFPTEGNRSDMVRRLLAVDAVNVAEVWLMEDEELADLSSRNGLT